MALSPGVRQAVGMAGTWLFVAGAGAFSVLYYSEINQVARRIVGQPAVTDRPAEKPPRADRQLRLSRSESAGRTVEIRAGAHGHFFASVEINGRPVDALIDSGASIVALSYDDARAAGISIRDSDYTGRVSTANGTARVAPVMLARVSIGDITVRNVAATVSEPGSLPTTLLGMSFLSRLQRVDMRAGVLILQE